jgi:hypothetical protein
MPIVFPENLPQQKQFSQIPPALRYITSLLYKSGTGLSLLYLVLLMAIQPLLEVQYDRRNELVSFALSKAIALLKLMGKKQSLPTVAIKRGDKHYSDAAVQTLDSEPVKTVNTYVTFADESVESDNKLNDKLQKLRDCVEHYNKYCISLTDLQPTTFQIKTFQGRIDAYQSAQLFKTNDRSISGRSAAIDIRNEIRTIKGWYLTGQV